MYEAVMIGYFDSVEQEAMRIQKSNSKYSKFATKNLEFAQDFERKKIANLIKNTG